jgi:hypothetical protein
MAGNHAFIHTQSENLIKHFLKYMFGKQLPGPANGAGPGQFLIDIMIEEEQDIQPHRTVIDQLAVAG